MPPTSQTKRQPWLTRREWLGLVPLLILATWLRSHINNTGLDHIVFQRNDEIHYTRLITRFLLDDWRVDYFINPTFAMYAMYAATMALGVSQTLAGRYDSLSDFVLDAVFDPYWVTVASRSLAGAAGVFSVLLVYLLGRRLFDRRVAWIASLAFAVDVIHVHSCGLVGGEPLLVLLSLGFLIAVVRYMERPGTRAHLLTGALLGLSISTKYNGGVHALTFALATLYIIYRERPTAGNRALRLHPRHFAGFVAAPLAFLVGSPWVARNFIRFREDFALQASFLKGGYGSHVQGWTYYPSRFADENAGLPFAICCLGGLLLSAWRVLRHRDPRAGFLLLVIVPSYIFFGRGIFAQMRFLLPVIPLILIAGAWALTCLVDRVVRTARGRSGVAATRAWALIAGAVLLLPQVAATNKMVQRAYGRVDSRGELRTWLHGVLDSRPIYMHYPGTTRTDFYTAPGLLGISPNDLESRAEQRIYRRLRDGSFRVTPLRSLVRDAANFESFQRAVAARRETHLILSFTCGQPLPNPIDPVAEVRAQLILARRAVRGCKYWKAAARAISGWEIVDYKVGRYRRRVAFVLKLP